MVKLPYTTFTLHVTVFSPLVAEIVVVPIFLPEIVPFSTVAMLGSLLFHVTIPFSSGII